MSPGFVQVGPGTVWQISRAASPFAVVYTMCEAARHPRGGRGERFGGCAAKPSHDNNTFRHGSLRGCGGDDDFSFAITTVVDDNGALTLLEPDAAMKLITMQAGVDQVWGIE
jgi:hypothetical protein